MGGCEGLEGFLERVEKRITGRVREARPEPVEPGYKWWQPWGDAWPLLNLHLLRGGRVPGPAAVIEASSIGDVEAVVEEAWRSRVCLVPRGGGSGVLGAVAARRCCVVLDLHRLDWIRVYPERGLVEAGAGTLLGRLEEELEKHGLTTGYYPQSLHYATVGGAVAALGSGALQPGYGNIEDIVEYLDVVVPGHGLLRLGQGPRGQVGPGVKSLLLGSEGTLGVIVAAGLRARKRPRHTATATIAFPTLEAALAAARSLVQWLQPQVLRVIGEAESRLLYSREGVNMIIAYMHDNERLAQTLLEAAIEEAARHGGRRVEDLYNEWWEARYRYGEKIRELWGAGLWFDTIEAMAYWDRLPRLARALEESLQDHALAAFTHISHFYPTGGAVYLTMITEADPESLARAWHRALETIDREGGVATHHHGIGLMKHYALTRDCPGWYKIYCSILGALDPAGTLNPHGLRAGCRKCRDSQ